MTFSLLARSGRFMAAATASYSLAVGNAVPAIAPGVGAVLSQAWTNRSLRHHALTALRAGVPAPDAMVELARLDSGWHQRQVAILPATGAGAAHTGAGCTQWAGAVVGADFIVAGNLLDGAGVLEAMVSSWSGTASGPTEHSGAEEPWAFAYRVAAALQAGDDAGGDARGKQSAALLLCCNEEEDLSPPQLLVDLRVDDAPEPLAELHRLLELAQAGAKAPAG